MKYRADLAAFDQSGNLILIVEVKRKKGTNSQWAVEMRQNLMERICRPVKYFLLALPDVFYLWTQKNISDLSSDPDYTIKTDQIFSNDDLKRIENASEDVLVMVIYEWLRRLSFKEVDSVQSDMIKSGLYDDIKDVYIQYEVNLW